MLSYPEIGEIFARELLETVFARSFGKLTVVPQKVYYGGDTDQHGARLDVYIEEVATEYMLWSERVWMWKEEGREEERKRTEAALHEVEVLKKGIERLRAQMS